MIDVVEPFQPLGRTRLQRRGPAGPRRHGDLALAPSPIQVSAPCSSWPIGLAAGRYGRHRRAGGRPSGRHASLVGLLDVLRSRRHGRGRISPRDPRGGSIQGAIGAAPGRLRPPAGGGPNSGLVQARRWSGDTFDGSRVGCGNTARNHMPKWVTPTLRKTRQHVALERCPTWSCGPMYMPVRWQPVETRLSSGAEGDVAYRFEKPSVQVPLTAWPTDLAHFAAG